ncbi:hypothetical protein M409DRAFT_67238 [Zasmidium cellare ATCC 36951]|uniref:Fatty acid desaturase domain-containing protein n=1 Tax=Zasmidium cellare ATCC 36951 TaxID=1080233 RepID=A0A6A6CGS6_ZASCE|nr:uncharacterized protein M409DRAFT_67238 [Zasmidium cellare ATCC 36951]KAF2165390.1 hypothetical protein M409DRAFT_67238 [Zasmidium cellare ATCC 36951]
MDNKISLRELRRAIPHHCFRPSNICSLKYVFCDLILAISLGWLASTLIPHQPTFPLRCISWMLYGYLQGLILTGIWILAHECGHEALFSSKIANHIVGFVLHSALLVPYFSWRYTHARHHRYTNHLGKDTAFVPRQEDETPRWLGMIRRFGVIEDTPFYAICSLVLHQVLGLPAYLLFYSSGAQDGPPNESWSFSRWSHFDPLSDLFTESEQPYVLLSTIGVGASISILITLAQAVGVTNAFLLYGIPYLWVNNWLVALTYLHHNDPKIPHFEQSTWTFLDGALSTVDRPFGFVGRYLFHGIVDYRVVHHLFPRISFYHAEEATKAIVPLLGEAYHKDETPFWLALWRTFRSCRSVEADGAQPGVLRWKAVPMTEQQSKEKST